MVARGFSDHGMWTVIEQLFAVGICNTDAVIQVLAQMQYVQVFCTNSLGHYGRWTLTCLVSRGQTLTKLLQNQSGCTCCEQSDHPAVRYDEDLALWYAVRVESHVTFLTTAASGLDIQ